MHPTDPRVRLRKLPVHVADGKVFVTVPVAKAVG
jgi:hypothetical protein